MMLVMATSCLARPFGEFTLLHGATESGEVPFPARCVAPKFGERDVLRGMDA